MQTNPWLAEFPKAHAVFVARPHGAIAVFRCRKCWRFNVTLRTFDSFADCRSCGRAFHLVLPRGGWSLLAA
jgi:hypothetical protein